MEETIKTDMEENEQILPGENHCTRQAGKVKVLGILVPVLQVCFAIGIQVVIFSVENLPLDLGFCVVGGYMLLSIFLMLFYLVYQRMKGRDICQLIENHHSNTHLLAGLYIFGVGTLLYSMLQIAGVIECISHGYETLYPFTILMFTIFQMLCLQAFVKRAMRYHWLLVFSLYSLIGTNFSSYITNTVLELHLISTRLNQTNGTNLTKCHGKVLYKEGLVWRESLISFVSEFNIISAGIIGSIIYNISAISSDFIENMQHDGNEDGNEDDNQAANEHNLLFRSQPGIAFGIFFGVLIVASIISVLYKHKVVLVFYSISISTSVIAMLMFVRMQCFIHSHHIRVAVQTDDILLFISVAGHIVKYFCNLYSSGQSIYDQDKLAIAWCSFFVSFFKISAAIFQVFILVQYLHLRRRIHSMVIKQFLYFILIQNLTLWAIDTFVYLRKDASYRTLYPTLDNYDTDYEMVASVANVFSIFFRFHSAVLAYEITSNKLT